MNDLKQIINRLRRAKSGKASNISYTLDCRDFANALNDDTPIDEEWLTQTGWDRSNLHESHYFETSAGRLTWQRTSTWVLLNGSLIRECTERGHLTSLLFSLGVFDA